MSAIASAQKSLLKGNFYITGVPGVGKSTVAMELFRRGYDSHRLDASGFCHWYEKGTDRQVEHDHTAGAEWLNRHEWRCDPAAVRKIIQGKEQAVFIEGVISNQKEFVEYFDKLILFTASDQTISHRLSTRKTNKFARDKEEQALVLKWRKKFEEEMKQSGAIVISTDQPLRKVVDELIGVCSA